MAQLKEPAEVPCRKLKRPLSVETIRPQIENIKPYEEEIAKQRKQKTRSTRLQKLTIKVRWSSCWIVSFPGFESWSSRCCKLITCKALSVDDNETKTRSHWDCVEATKE